MTAEARMWSVGAILMYVASALFLVKAADHGNMLSILAAGLMALAGGLFLLAGAKRAASHT